MCGQVGHVGVHSCQVLRSQRFTAPELLESAAGAGFRPAMTWRLMSAVLGELTSLSPGQYLLTHQPGSEAICLFAATSEAELASEVSLLLVSKMSADETSVVCTEPTILVGHNIFVESP